VLVSEYQRECQILQSTYLVEVPSVVLPLTGAYRSSHYIMGEPMYQNLMQPLINYTNAQIETVTRFAQSRDLTELTRSSS
jgi:hypothetical protein